MPNGSKRDDRQQEDQGEHGEQDVQRDLVRRLLAIGALDERDHAVEEGLAGIGRDAHHDPIGEHARAAGHGGAVAAALADDGGRLAGDRGLVHGGDALDDVAVAGDQVAGLDQHEIALAQLRCGDQLGGRGAEAGAVVARLQPLRRRLAPRATQGVGLGFAAALRHRLGEIGEEHREPQPNRHAEDETPVTRQSGVDQRPYELNGGDDAANLDDEHHRVLGLDARIELLERVARPLAA